jgi:3-deoxy-manno-octulosonate cytidylyltransferase (CMP-KDO synthetase)
MIVRTLERAQLAECFDRVVCATDSEAIAEVVSRAGFEFLLTGPAKTGSDRVAEAARALDLDLVVNLQGDEPLVEPDVLVDVANELASHPDCWVSVACPLAPADAELATVVKVRVEDGFAVDFTRHVDPGDVARWFQHQGIYAYSRESREEFSALPQSAVEKERSLEQMRIMGRRPIRMVMSRYPSVSVDVPSDAAAVETLIKSLH